MIGLGKSAKKTLLTLARAVLPTFGFGLICLGAFLLSVQINGGSHPARLAVAYVCIILGFLLLLTGVIWTVCLGVKSKVLLQRQRRRPQPRSSHIYTVDRPDFYPPSYEESLDREASAVSESVWITETETRYNTAPPLYTANITEIPSEDYSSEDPPSYGEAVLQGLTQLETNPANSTPATPTDRP